MNRRRGRPMYVLDVRVSGDSRWSARMRRGVKWVLGLGVVAVVAWGLARGGVWVLDRLLFANPRFAIADVVIENDGVLEPRQVMRLAGVRPGQNLFDVDLEDVRRQLEMVPLIRRAEVRREVPRRLRIRVEERIPVFQTVWTTPSGREERLYLDASGVVMNRLRLPDGSVVEPRGAAMLPELRGVPPTELLLGRRSQSERVQRALGVLEKWSASPMSLMLSLTSVDVEAERLVRVHTREGVVVSLGAEEVGAQLRRLGAILLWARQHQRSVHEVNLTVASMVPVTLAN
ncbi:MAG: FtsQ-type POTRA domain-containing protein [Verrucomicrobiae bacterium]|nr:FtsQ-type POTRA domain-containing protein [Verrucomicrobiae bacterium]